MEARHIDHGADHRSDAPVDFSQPLDSDEDIRRDPHREWDLPSSDFLVESAIVAVLTRFGLKRRRHLVQTYLAYRWLLRKVRRTSPGGLLNAVFLIENSTTCWSLSLWADEAAIPHFGTSVKEHVSVARDVFGRLRFHQGYPEIWSTKWRLHRASNNLNWDGCDLGQIAVAQVQTLR